MTAKTKKQTQPQDLSVEIDFLLGLRLRMPNDVDLLKILGDDLTKAGRFQEGLEVDLELASLQPDDPLVFYNLACSYSILEDLPHAASALTKAVKLGYSDVDWMTKDPDLKNLRATPEFDKVLSSLLDKVKKA